MELSLNDVSKVYGETWVLRNINCELTTSARLAIKGHNGSGKSTLLSIIIGMTLPSEGTVIFSNKGKPIHRDEVGLMLSFAAPYQALFNEFTIIELLSRIGRMRPFNQGWSVKDIVSLAMLNDHVHKSLDQYSTGMRQRLRLAIAFALKSEMIILDEPTSNLDQEGKIWFQNLVSEHLNQRTLIIASNEANDLKLCNQNLELKSYF